MGESISSIIPSFNQSIRIEGRPERLTCEAGALLLREADERLGLTTELALLITDHRDPGKIQFSMRELLRTAIILPAMGWKDQDDSDYLRHDPALKTSISDERGLTPLIGRAGDEAKGLASQPTLSRLHEALSSDENRAALGNYLLTSAATRLKAQNNGHRQRYVTLDIDSLPIEVEGHQPGAEFNGHYDTKMFHPLIATAAELGDVLGVKLRPGAVHTADGGLDFILDLVERCRRELCQIASVRIDAGFPEEETLAGLEKAGVPYTARIKCNKILNRMAEPYLTRPKGRPPLEGRMWTCEMSYQAASWSKARRVVLVVNEFPGELLLHHFWLVTSWSEGEKDSEELVSHYRQRGTAEGIFGELMDGIEPTLSSNKRPKSHYRGQCLPKKAEKNLSFAINEVRFMLAALAYNLAHTVRCAAQDALQTGMRIKRVRERYLKVAARITMHGRRMTIIITDEITESWDAIWRKLKSLGTVSGRL